MIRAKLAVLALVLSTSESTTEGGPWACAADVNQCADGSFVSRDAANGCQFEACPEGGTGVAAQSVLRLDEPLPTTTDGTTTDELLPTTDGTTIYELLSTTTDNTNETVCALDVQDCADGSFVSRDAANGCQFRACPTSMDESTTEDGAWLACTGDVKECADGSFVSRDAANECQFRACPLETSSSFAQPAAPWQLVAPSVLGLSLLLA